MNFTTISKASKETELSYLGSINSSAKIAKNGKVNNQNTYSLYLAPAETSGYNVCSHSTNECRLGCLATSGRTKMDINSGQNRIINSRIKKTKLFFEQPDFFMAWLIAEITKHKAGAKKQGAGFSARLNCTSDIDWQNVRVDDKNIFELFPDVQFYDYTKNPNKFINLPDNYHLTFSYTGRNWNACEALLKRGYNIAVVFKKELPDAFKGFKVVNGDLTDYRVADGKGVIIGLKWKRIANKEAENAVLDSIFVVDGIQVRKDDMKSVINTLIDNM